MYFHKPQEKPRRWGSFQDVQYAVMKNCEKIYNVDPDSIVLAMPLFWGLPCLDYSGKNNHGTNHGATYKDGSLDFDGNNDYVDCNEDNQFQLANGTALARICLRSYSGSANEISGIIVKDQAGWNDDFIFSIGIDGGGNNQKLSGTIQRASNTTRYQANDTTSFPLNERSLAAITWGTNGMKLYRNKNQVGSNAYTGAIVSSGQNLTIGEVQQNANRFFDGIIDEIRISNVDRTADQIALFHALPYGLYQPVSRPVYFFQAAGGGLSIPVAMSHYLRQMGA